MNDQPTKQPLSRRVLSAIEQGNLTPTPRWTFQLRNMVFWTLGAASLVLGAFAFSATLFEVDNAGWEFFPATHGDFLSFFLQAAPFLWLLVLALFVLVGYENVRYTKHGYRYPLSLIVVGAILTSVVLGSALYAAGAGERVEEALGDHPPFYRPILLSERGWWSRPQEGLLAGQVISASPDLSRFVLQDFRGTAWNVQSTDLNGDDLSVVAHGGMVRVIGTPTVASSTMFHACIVFAWMLPGAPSLPPIGLLSSSSETIASSTRSQLCKGIRPYEVLRFLSRDTR